jgi:Asp-tRNA(Asn)/Glu-tRNA(Gln) amidotransferase C subunit
MENQVSGISTGAFKVLIPISQWAGRKKDKRASQKVNEDNQAEAGASTVNKSLLGSCPELAAIGTLVGQVRNHYLYVQTMPWDNAGWRLLPTPLMFDFMEMMTQKQAEFYQLVEIFLANYSNAKLAAQAHYTGLGELFDEADYPTEDELRAKFKFEIEKEPIAESGDWRIDVQNEAMADLKSEYENMVDKRVEGAVTDVWSQLHDKLSKLAERIDYTDDETKKVFKASTVDNLLQLVDLLDAFNVTGDETMTNMSKDLKRALRGVSAEGLREDEGLRAETKKNLDAAIRSLPSMG